MTTPILVIMAAGMGSRYGGLKQIDPIDDQGNLMIDFSIYDAIQAGFKKVIFIIKPELECDFRERIGDRISNYIEVEYAYQRIDPLPDGYSVPQGRVKPWGTGHAILCCMDLVQGPFAVINADDYYGSHAFSMIYKELTKEQEKDAFHYSMVGYILENTLTEHGSVARGVCEVNDNGLLKKITERTRIEKHGDVAAYTEDDGLSWTDIPLTSTVSMNLWGFQNSILPILKEKFIGFLEEEVVKNPMKAEYFLPGVVGDLLSQGKAVVTVLESKDKWYGVTYKEDKQVVMDAIRHMKDKGLYPKQLWQ